jgi:hypothetical protein
MIFMIALAGLIIWLIYGTNIRTAHALTDKSLILHQGIFFKKEIPFKYISSIDHVEKPYSIFGLFRIKPGVRFFDGTFYILTSGTNQIILTFTTSYLIRMRFAEFRVYEIIFNVDEPDKLINEYKTRRKVYDKHPISTL